MKKFVKENWLKIAVVLLLGISIFSFNLKKQTQNNENKEEQKIENDNKNKESDDVPKVGGMDFNLPFEKNKEIEYLYKNLTNLPKHHTACFPVKKYYCTVDECNEITPTVFNLFGGNRSYSTISRCDENPCDTYDTVFDDSGDYKVIQPVEPKGFIFKMSYNTVDKKYIEVVILGIDTYITYGYCKYDFELLN